MHEAKLNTGKKVISQASVHIMYLCFIYTLSF